MRRTAIAVAMALVLAACGGTDVNDVGIGDCFDDPETELVSSLELIECAEPHDNEVFAEVFMSDASFPGDNGVAEFAFEEDVADPATPANNKRSIEPEAAFFRLDVVDGDLVEQRQAGIEDGS